MRTFAGPYCVMTHGCNYEPCSGKPPRVMGFFGLDLLAARNGIVVGHRIAGVPRDFSAVIDWPPEVGAFGFAESESVAIALHESVGIGSV